MIKNCVSSCACVWLSITRRLFTPKKNWAKAATTSASVLCLGSLWVAKGPKGDPRMGQQLKCPFKTRYIMVGEPLKLIDSKLAHILL